MEKTYNMYLCHTNEWYWGISVDIVRKDGIGIICVKLDNDYPQTAFICDLSVHELYRHNGIGRELLDNALEVARKHNRSYAEINVDKTKDWLVAWYTELGFEITYVGKDEYTMFKAL